MRIILRKIFFTDQEKVLFEKDDLLVSIYKFESGIEALRIKNELGYIIVLPFKGQLIWEAVFNGRTLNMYRINKTQPEPSNFYLDSAFGTFFFHCGALRAGVPGVGDDHPLHGELPYADYDEAELVIGKDERGSYVGIGGTFRYNRGFAPCYEAHPLTKVYSKSSLLDISIRIDNMSGYPMELMYIAHVNFRPIPNARIVQSHPWTPEAMPLRDYTRDHKPIEYTQDFVELQEKLKKNPELTQIIDPDATYKPEVGYYLDDPKVDGAGWSHMMQVLTDGTADFLMYKPSELPHGLRWLSKYDDQAGFSLAFPSTCNIEGYTEEKRQGRVAEIEPHGSFSSTVIAGSLDAESVEKEEAIIKSIMR